MSDIFLKNAYPHEIRKVMKRIKNNFEKAFFSKLNLPVICDPAIISCHVCQNAFTHLNGHFTMHL